MGPLLIVKLITFGLATGPNLILFTCSA